MPLQYKQIQITDFSGGITDKHVNAAPGEHKELTNYYVNEIGKPELVPGYNVVYDSEDVKRIMGIFKLGDDVLVNRFEHMYKLDPSGGTLTKIDPVNLTSPLFPYYGNTSYPNAARWRDQLVVTNTGQESPLQYNRPRVIYKDDLSVLNAFEAGLPFVSDDMTLVATDPGVGYGYIYAYHYSYEYNVENTVFRVVGPVNFSDRIEKIAKITAGTQMNATDIDTLGITAPGSQYDIANIKLEIYRTTGNGTTYYKIPTTGNPATELLGEYDINSLPGGLRQDVVEDDVLQNGEIIYNQETPEYNPAPKCKYVTVSNDAIYFMNAVEEVQDVSTRAVTEYVRPYRVYQSVPGNPGVIDPTAYLDLDDTIMGGGSLNGIAIVMTKTKIYRVEGQLDGAGNGSMRKKTISDTAGCISHRSIIVANDRMYWCGANGFYVTDGFNVSLITPRLLDSYSVISANNSRGERITATYFDKEQRIVFATSDDDSENNEWWIFNIKAGTAFTKAKGSQMLSSAVMADGNTIYRGDELGYIYGHNRDNLTHFQRDQATPASSWLPIHIPYKLETATFNMGNSAIRKWGRETTITIKTDTNQSILPASNNDDERSIKDMVEIRRFGGWLWRDDNVLWLDNEIQWRNADTKSKQRHFPRGHSRFRTKSVSIEPSKTILYNSDWWGEAVVSYVNPSNPSDIFVTLSGTDEWPIDISVDRIVFEEEGYTAEHTIINRADQVLTVSGGTISPGANKKWHIIGYKKEVRQEVKEITITYADASNVGDRYDKSEDGDNG